MDTTLIDLLLRQQAESSGGSTGGSTAVCVGRVIHVAADGAAWVDFPGNPVGPVAARSLVTVPDAAKVADAAVLLWLAPRDPAGPIILGVVADKLVRPAPETPAPATAAALPAPAAVKDSLVLEAGREVVLRCGPSSLTLRKDGKVLLKGAAVVTHATGLNRIKGASVQIN